MKFTRIAGAAALVAMASVAQISVAAPAQAGCRFNLASFNMQCDPAPPPQAPPEAPPPPPVAQCPTPQADGSCLGWVLLP